MIYRLCFWCLTKYLSWNYWFALFLTYFLGQHRFNPDMNFSQLISRSLLDYASYFAKVDYLIDSLFNNEIIWILGFNLFRFPTVSILTARPNLAWSMIADLSFNVSSWIVRVGYGYFQYCYFCYPAWHSSYSWHYRPPNRCVCCSIGLLNFHARV